MMYRGKIAIRGACHHNKPVLIATPQQQATKRHDTAIGKLNMPGRLWGRPFIPSTGDDQTPAIHEGFPKRRLLGSRFHPRIDQETAALAGW